MKKLKKIAALVLVAAMVLSLAACGKSSGGDKAESSGDGSSTAALEGSYSFIVGSSSTQGTTITKTFEHAQELASQESGGKLNMTYYGASQLGTDGELLQSCLAGDVPIVVMTTASLTKAVPELALFDMHCAFSSMDTLTALMTDPDFGPKIQSWFEKAGLKLIAWESQSSKLLASTKEIHDISDFAGYDMRTLDNKYHMAFWRAVGANTVQIDASELYLSVQQGLIDGIEMNMASILSRQLTEVCDYVVETMDLPHMSVAVMNLDAYNSMTENDRKWFDDFMSGINDYFNQTGKEDNENGWTTVEENGATAIRFNQTLFDQMQAIAKDSSWALVRQDLGDELVDSYLDAINNIEGQK